MKNRLAFFLICSFFFITACDDDGGTNNSNNLNNSNNVNNSNNSNNLNNLNNSNNSNNTNSVDCIDLDDDTHNKFDASTCPQGDDWCDNDQFNWSENGCQNCVDNDSDGYGDSCDMGDDCNDNDNSILKCPIEICYHGDYETPYSGSAGCYDVANSSYEILTTTGLDSTLQFDGMAFSPNGDYYVVSGLNQFVDPVLNRYSFDSSEVVTLAYLFSSTHNVNAESIKFSPDGAYIAYLADKDTSIDMQLFVVPTDGSTPPVLISPPFGESNQDVDNYQWSPDISGSQRYIAFTGDVLTKFKYGIWIVDITAPTPSPITIAEENILKTVGFDNNGNLYYLKQTQNASEIWRSNVDGTNQLQVPGTNLTNSSGHASIANFTISPSRTKIAFSSNSPEEKNFEIFVMNISTTTATKISDVGATIDPVDARGPIVDAPLVWSPDESHLGVVTDWQIPGEPYVKFDYCVYILPTQEPAGGVRIVTPISPDEYLSINNLLFSLDSSTLFILEDLITQYEYELFSTNDFTTPDQNPTTILKQNAPTDGDVDFMVIP
jgi:WD40-like Beta Propeller Repeat